MRQPGHTGVSALTPISVCLTLEIIGCTSRAISRRADMGKSFVRISPDTGAAIIVLDYVDQGLRKMETGVKIVRYDSWAAAQIAKTDEEAPTVLQMEPNLYNKGSITIEHQFKEPGYFVGLVSSQVDGQEPIVSRFPFSVGYGKGSTESSSFNLLMYLGLILLAAGGGYYYLNSQKKKEGEQAAA